ncbi:MAG: hypothetical protein P8Z77_03030 [Candidatus Thiodiazotropha sp.]
MTLLISTVTFAEDFSAVKFHKVAAKGDVIPGSSRTFYMISDASTSKGNVVFISVAQGMHYGVYRYSEGALTTVAETGDEVPGGGGFVSFHSPAIYGETVVFRGISKDLNGKRHEGVYLSHRGSLSVMVDDSMKFPGSEKYFGSFREIDMFGKEVVFRAFGHGEAGIFKYSEGKLTLIADESVPIPNSQEVFAGALEPKISQGMVVFQGYQHTTLGIYQHDGTKIETVANVHTTVPGTKAHFEEFTIPSNSGSTVAFWSKYGDHHNGIYRFDEKGLSVVADDSTQAPGKDAYFRRFFHMPSVSNGKVAFVAEDSDGVKGIYLHDGKVLHKVIDSKGTIDGKLVYDSNKSIEGFRSRSYDQDYLVFLVKFMDNSRALYMAELPW